MSRKIRDRRASAAAKKPVQRSQADPVGKAAKKQPAKKKSGGSDVDVAKAAGHHQAQVALPPPAAGGKRHLTAGNAEREMSVKVELKAGARTPRIDIYDYDATTDTPKGEPRPVNLTAGVGKFLATAGAAYLLDWRFDGILGSNIQVTVYYPVAANAPPPKPAFGKQAAQKTSDKTAIASNAGFNEGFLVVPDAGVIQ